MPVVKDPVVDPAIVSFARRTVLERVRDGQSQQLGPSDSVSVGPHRPSDQTKVKPRSQTNDIVAPPTKQFPTSDPSQVTLVNASDVTPSATLTGPFTDLSLDVKAIEGNEDSDNYKPVPARKEFLAPKRSHRRGKRPGKAQNGISRSSMDAEMPAGNSSNGLMTPNTGLQPIESAIGWGKKHKRRYRGSDFEDQNGWATGEATDIQEMGDFDFEEGLSKFDKQKVFEQIKQDDTTADEDWLHSFNRRSRPGTAGGKNLHHTENVLNSPKQKIAGHSSGDDELEISDNRRGSDRSIRKTLPRKPPSRQGSVLTSMDLPMTASGSLPDIRGSRPESVLSNPIATAMALSKSFSRSRRSSARFPKVSLRIAGSDRLCFCVSPLQMLELEQLAISEFGLTEDMITENAARCIADTALSICHAADAGTKNSSTVNTPTIYVMGGNTKTGSRAIAAARHIRNHGARVISCMMGVDREDDLLESVRRQLHIFRSCGGRVIRQDQLMSTLQRFQASTDLMIDAVLSMHLSFDDLRTDDQAAFLELVGWANSSGADVLSIDIPSGIDASTGKSPPPSSNQRVGSLLISREGIVTQNEDTPIGFLADHILSLGAPKNGLLSGQFEELYKDHAKRDFRVADIGIPSAAWKRFGKKGRHWVEFRGRWVVSLDYYHEGTT